MRIGRISFTTSRIIDLDDPEMVGAAKFLLFGQLYCNAAIEAMGGGKGGLRDQEWTGIHDRSAVSAPHTANVIFF